MSNSFMKRSNKNFGLVAIITLLAVVFVLTLGKNFSSDDSGESLKPKALDTKISSSRGSDRPIDTSGRSQSHKRLEKANTVSFPDRQMTTGSLTISEFTEDQFSETQIRLGTEDIKPLSIPSTIQPER